MASCQNANALDFQDPGRIPSELLDMPGFVHDLKSHTLAVAPRPNETLAFAGALAMLAHLSGRTYRDERGTRTNLYLAALAPTGMGKDEPRRVNKILALSADTLGSLADAVASGEALEDAVAESPSLLLQNDEADALLTALRSGGSHAARLNEMVLRFYSEAKSGHAMRQKAGDGAVSIILQPHLTLFATGIPKFFYSAMTPKALENGLLGRCLFFDNEDFVPLGEQKSCALPEQVVAAARHFVRLETAICDSGEVRPIVVPETDEAKRRIREMMSDCDEITRRLLDGRLATAAALYVRVPEKALKLAMLYAISENPEAPVIGNAAVEHALGLVTHLTKRMLYLSQFYVAEGRFDRLKKRAIGLLAAHGGQLDRSSLLRSLSIDAGTFNKVLLTLHASDMIEEERISRRKCIITLKNAA